MQKLFIQRVSLLSQQANQDEDEDVRNGGPPTKYSKTRSVNIFPAFNNIQHNSYSGTKYGHKVYQIYYLKDSVEDQYKNRQNLAKTIPIQSKPVGFRVQPIGHSAQSNNSFFSFKQQQTPLKATVQTIVQNGKVYTIRQASKSQQERPKSVPTSQFFRSSIQLQPQNNNQYQQDNNVSSNNIQQYNSIQQSDLKTSLENTNMYQIDQNRDPKLGNKDDDGSSQKVHDIQNQHILKSMGNGQQQQFQMVQMDGALSSFDVDHPINSLSNQFLQQKQQGLKENQSKLQQYLYATEKQNRQHISQGQLQTIQQRQKQVSKLDQQLNMIPQYDGAGSDQGTGEAVDWEDEQANQQYEGWKNTKSEFHNSQEHKPTLDMVASPGGGASLTLKQEASLYDSDQGGEAMSQDSQGDDVVVDDQDDNVDNVIVALYEKVTKRKDKWRVQMKGGFIIANGKDYIFNKGQGEFDFMGKEVTEADS